MPEKGAAPDHTAWSLVPTLMVDHAEETALARKNTAFILAPNRLDAVHCSHKQVISTEKEQGGVERGFRLLKDPVFRASSVFVKKPERVLGLRVGVSTGQASAASPTARHPTHCSDPQQPPDQPSHDALDFPTF